VLALEYAYSLLDTYKVCTTEKKAVKCTM